MTQQSISATVLRQIAANRDNGATDDEIEVALDLPHQSASAARRMLERRGLVTRPGTTRKTRSGYAARVSYITGEGLAKLGLS